MADFKPAYKKTMGHEGGYGNDPDDSGGETYKGVARKKNPTWRGWALIDALKNRSDFPARLDKDDDVQDAVLELYKKKYWDCYRADELTQAVAEELFDTGVNMGTSRAAKFFQHSLNALNRNGRTYGDIAVDGAVGSGTIGAYKSLVSKDGDKLLLKFLNVLQGARYIDIMDRKPSQEKYARGWFNRVEI